MKERTVGGPDKRGANLQVGKRGANLGVRERGANLQVGKRGANLQVCGNAEAEALPGTPVQRGGEGRQVRVILPAHLQTLAHVGAEVTVAVEGLVTQRSVLDALEARYPPLRGTTRDHATGKRRPFIRFFACEEDLSNQPPDATLPEEVAAGEEPLLIIGAIAGG